MVWCVSQIHNREILSIDTVPALVLQQEAALGIDEELGPWRQRAWNHGQVT